MKIYDDVKVISNNEKYEKEGVYKGMIGYIVMPEIRYDCFLVCFIDESFKKHNDDYDWFTLHYNEIKDDINNLRYLQSTKQNYELIENQIEKVAEKLTEIMKTL